MLDKLLCIILMSLFIAFGCAAALSEAEADRLGRDLTPLGAERVGNAAGSIPPWTGGIMQPPADYRVGMHHPDPFAADPVMVKITADNMAEHAANLTIGSQALLRRYPDTYYLNVFPTRRSASQPQWIYNATRKHAVTSQLIADGDGVTGVINGIPFPLPKDGKEVIWNHLLRYRGNAVAGVVGQAAVTQGGSYTLVKFDNEFNFIYSRKGISETEIDNKILYFKQEIVAPARLAGSILLVHEPLDQVSEPRQAWLYNPGLRRVRRAPHVAYDNPGTATDGLRTNDQFDMFNGAIDRYDWKLLGKKEYYVPYNAYRLQSDALRYDDILAPGHINPEYLRYELHRVWVVEATLKENMRHIYKRRTFYVDEDSWQILAVEQYDNRDQLWRVSEGHVINYYEVPTIWTTLEVHMDLQSGRYLALGLKNEEDMYDFNAGDSNDFTPNSLRREGVR